MATDLNGGRSHVNNCFILSNLTPRSTAATTCMNTVITSIGILSPDVAPRRTTMRLLWRRSGASATSARGLHVLRFGRRRRRRKIPLATSLFCSIESRMLQYVLRQALLTLRFCRKRTTAARFRNLNADAGNLRRSGERGVWLRFGPR
jgi:hypothetical protein